jgi:methenyltetrahydrofolate cyclohydrolase
MIRAGESAVGAYLDAVGARTPAPASGAGAALTGAIAAALAELAARFSDDPEATETARELGARLTALADADGEAFIAFMATRSDEDRARTIDVPLSIAEAAAAVAVLAAGLVERGNPNVAGDAESAVALATAAAGVCARLVEINLRGAADPRLERARAAAAPRR